MGKNLFKISKDPKESRKNCWTKPIHLNQSMQVICGDFLELEACQLSDEFYSSTAKQTSSCKIESWLITNQPSKQCTKEGSTYVIGSSPVDNLVSGQAKFYNVSSGANLSFSVYFLQILWTDRINYQSHPGNRISLGTRKRKKEDI